VRLSVHKLFDPGVPARSNPGIIFRVKSDLEEKQIQEKEEPKI
jgi:hypothetical protein